MRAVIFDLDGTLLYSLDDLTECINITMRKFGFREHSVQEVREAIGNGVKLLMERITPEGIDERTFSECLAFFKDCYSKNMYNKTEPYDGVIELLERLRADGFKIAVLSNKFDSAVRELCEKYFDGLIDVAVGQKEGIEEKPAPDGVYAIVEDLGVNLEDCVFVGDSEVDIQTASNAGIECISVVWGYKDIDFLYKNGAIKLAYVPNDVWELL